MKMISFVCTVLLYPLPFSSLGADATPTPNSPTWPSDGIAQREFRDGSLMFVENDHGKWHAWVLTETNGPNVEAMDFFTGEHQKVKVKLSADGHQFSVFTDKNGKVHHRVVRDDPNSFGTSMYGITGVSINNGVYLRLNGTDARCSLNLNVTTNSEVGPVTLRKVPLYYSSPQHQGCPSGDWHSSIGSVLDLDDGTFLATTPCRVFRLHKSDLSPVGSAPSLHVVDASTVEAALAQTEDKSIEDPTTYLSKALHLPMDNNTSCKEN